MKGLIGDLFDFTHVGKVSAFGGTAELNRTELELSGLDPDELEFMNVEKRREVLKNAGLDPDEYDF